MAGALRVIVADDHPLFRQGVVRSLQEDGDIEVVGEAADSAGAVDLARQHQPDLILLDVNMPGAGLKAAHEIAASCPMTRVVMLTVSEDHADVLAAMNAGASGFVLKGVSASDLREVVLSVCAGGVYLPPALAWQLVRENSGPRGQADALATLSAREREVLDLVASGLSNQEIGRRLGLAEKTIKHYMTSVLGKLLVRTRVEAALLAHKAGLGR